MLFPDMPLPSRLTVMPQQPDAQSPRQAGFRPATARERRPWSGRIKHRRETVALNIGTDDGRRIVS